MSRIIALVFVLLLLMPFAAHAQGSPAPQLEAAVNDARASVGVARLTIDSRLEMAAQQKIAHMQSSGCYLPRCVNFPGPYERQLAAGYPTTGFASELIDTDHHTVSEVVAYWMTEGSGDRFILTLGSFTDLGCASGLAPNTSQVLWVCDFGQASGTAPSQTPAPFTPTATLAAPTATQTPVPATSTSVPPTSTLTPVRGTAVPVEELGECARVWYADDHGGSWARFTGRMTRLQCVGF